MPGNTALPGRRAATGRAAALAVLLFGIANSAPADTLYQCQAYNGAQFFSAKACRDHHAFIVREHSVPSGLSLAQQVALVEQVDRDRQKASAEDARARAKRDRCRAIDAALTRLAQKYSRHEYVPVDEVNADQAEQQRLKTERSRLAC